jgi:uncharacterized membrane protein YdbT with pleckstrin-like domain
MSYADKLLARDEQILHYGRQHWLAPLSDSLRPIVLVLLGLVLFFLPIDPIKTVLLIASGLLLLVGVVWIAIVYMTWRSEEYIITNRRVLKVEGLLDKKSGDSSLDKINDAVLTQGLLARMLHYGDLEILTANDDAIDKYQMLSHVVDFKKAMLDAKNALEDGYRGGKATPAVAAAPVAAGRVSSADDVATTLSKLADLRDKGAITQAEYDQKKAELLGRL